MNAKMAHQKIIYQLTDKRIPAASGIGIVGDILERAGFLRRFRDVKLAEKRSRKQIDAGAVMTTFIALLCMGKPDFECVRELQNDAAYYQNALHLNNRFSIVCYAAPTYGRDRKQTESALARFQYGLAQKE